MKKDKEWLKNEVKSLYDEAYDSGKMEYHESEESIHRINNLVDQLDEPQKPVVTFFSPFTAIPVMVETETHKYMIEVTKIIKKEEQQ